MAEMEAAFSMTYTNALPFSRVWMGSNSSNTPYCVNFGGVVFILISKSCPPHTHTLPSKQQMAGLVTALTVLSPQVFMHNVDHLNFLAMSHMDMVNT